MCIQFHAFLSGPFSGFLRRFMVPGPIQKLDWLDGETGYMSRFKNVYKTYIKPIKVIKSYIKHIKTDIKLINTYIKHIKTYIKPIIL